jgi:hypothetical protein
MLRILQTAKSKAPRKTADGKERAKPTPEMNRLGGPSSAIFSHWGQ